MTALFENSDSGHKGHEYFCTSIKDEQEVHLAVHAREQSPSLSVLCFSCTDSLSLVSIPWRMYDPGQLVGFVLTQVAVLQ